MLLPSPYYDLDEIARKVAEGHHRDVIGGLWDEIGRLQFDFLVENGLQHEQRLIDIGCGCLRGGVHFVEYLDIGNYFGTDISQALLDAGHAVELPQRGLQARVDKSQLRCGDSFNFGAFGTSFDVALAQSLFTHLSANSIRLCLTRLAQTMAIGGRFYATFFIVPDDHPFGEPFRHPGLDGSTNDHADPYHYRFRDICRLCTSLPWRPALIGEWGHPRGQQMVLFEYTGGHARPRLPDSAVRRLSVELARDLPAGADHYRAFVGPPDRYDFISGSQFALLFSLGLRDYHKVLDFGCGSLRLGRLLIPFLQAGRYFAIEPNTWLVEDGIEQELGSDILAIKQPSFASNDDFDCNIFGQKFDFIVAQSIITHCGIDVTEKLAQQFAGSLAEGGRAVFSITEAPELFARPTANGWTYPECVAYGALALRSIFRQAGLACHKLPWYHPGATWFIAARDEAALPRTQDMWLLRGAVLTDPQFADSKFWPAPVRHAPLAAATLRPA
jgi:SAM-dependent methyltransferase